MQLKTLQLALIFLNFLRLEAQANVQNNGWQKVLSDDFRRERDKSSARTRKNPQEELRLRHEQHHLRQQQHQMAWEQQLQLQLQQHLQQQQQEQEQQQQQPQARPVRHQQHKSQPRELAKKPIRQAQSFADDKAKILDSMRRLFYNEYDNEDLELHTIQTDEDGVTGMGRGTFSPRQWQQIEIAHRRQKEQHQLQLLAERQQQRQLLTTTTTTTKPNDAKSEDNDVS